MNKLEGLRTARMKTSDKIKLTGAGLLVLVGVSTLKGDDEARDAANEVMYGEMTDVERGVLREENVVLYPGMNQDGTAYEAPERTTVNQGALDEYNKESGDNVSISEAYTIGNNMSTRVQDAGEAYDARLREYLHEPAFRVVVDLPVNRKQAETGLFVGGVALLGVGGYVSRREGQKEVQE